MTHKNYPTTESHDLYCHFGHPNPDRFKQFFCKVIIKKRKNEHVLGFKNVGAARFREVYDTSK